MKIIDATKPNNFKTAKATFNIPDQIKSGYCEYKERATVRIKNYDIFIVESEGSDYAKLLSAKTSALQKRSNVMIDADYCCKCNGCVGLKLI